tara:strand:- start:358 stop:1011 length:654 start_codon:yes stop_codon:yes gene_type:complete
VNGIESLLVFVKTIKLKFVNTLIFKLLTLNKRTIMSYIFGNDLPQKQDDSGISYIFLHYNNLYKKWEISQFRFRLINTKVNQVGGQFLTSNWFSTLFKENETGHFMVLGINKPFKYSVIKDIINSSEINQILYHKLNEAEIECGITFKDYYMINHDTINKILQKKELLNKEQLITLNGYNGLSKLSISGRIIEKKKLYVTLPEFTMNVNETLDDLHK